MALDDDLADLGIDPNSPRNQREARIIEALKARSNTAALAKRPDLTHLITEAEERLKDARAGREFAGQVATARAALRAIAQNTNAAKDLRTIAQAVLLILKMVIRLARLVDDESE